MSGPIYASDPRLEAVARALQACDPTTPFGTLWEWARLVLDAVDRVDRLRNPTPFLVSRVVASTGYGTDVVQEVIDNLRQVA